MHLGEHTTQLPDSTCRPVPVLMAASRQRRLWPFSTPSAPFCMREIGGRPSLLLRNLQAIEATAAYDRPIVVLKEEAAVNGAMEIKRIRPDAAIIVVPGGSGSGISAILAALISENRSLALIPASFTADNPVEAFAFLAAQFSEKRDFPVVVASRKTSAREGMYMELASRRQGDEQLHELASLHIRGDGDLASALQVTASIAKATGLVAYPAAHLVNHLGKSWPTLLSACRNALALKQDVGTIIRPHGDFLRLAGRPGIRDLLQAVLPHVAAVIGNPDWRTIDTFRDPIFDHLEVKPTATIAVCGYSDHRLIESCDGVLVLKPGHEDEAQKWYPTNETATRNAPGHPHFPSIRFSA